MEKAIGTFADTQNKIARLESELSSARVAASEFEQNKITRLESELSSARFEASEFERKIKVMKSTASWRFTAPLRELRRASLRLTSTASSIRMVSFLDRQAWRKFFRNVEKKFRLMRRALWKRKAKLPPSGYGPIRPRSKRGETIQSDLYSAIRRCRDAA